MLNSSSYSRHGSVCCNFPFYNYPTGSAMNVSISERSFNIRHEDVFYGENLLFQHAFYSKQLEMHKIILMSSHQHSHGHSGLLSKNG